MSLYVMADLHLSGADSKPMDIFGSRWQDHTEKIRKYWSAVVEDGDTVVVPGDISWSMTLNGALCDLAFIESLPGKKLLGKGNHDFWWSTVSKMKSFLDENGFATIDFLYNNAFYADDFIVCGSRGWFYDQKQQNVVGEVDYDKIINREAMRLELSITQAEQLRAGAPGGAPEILVFLHFPPVWGDFRCREIIDVLLRHQIRRCYFGHIHGSYNVPRLTNFEGIDMILVSADFLRFAPMPIFPSY